MKNQYIESGFAQKGGGAWTVCQFKGGGLARKRERGVFEGWVGLIPRCTLLYILYMHILLQLLFGCHQEVHNEFGSLNSEAPSRA